MKVAVTLISYNQEKYIYDALVGISNQTLQPDEVVIADDCSTDRTRHIIENYVKNNNLVGKWKLIFNEHNIGITKNLRKTLEYVTAEIVVGMAGDDISLPNRCAHAVECFNKYPDLYMISGSIFKINSSGNNIGEIIYSDEIKNDIKSVIKNGTPNVFPVGIAYKRAIFNLFGKLPIDVPNEDDQLMFWGLLSGGIFCSQTPVIKYRIHQSSASAWLRNRQNDKEFYKRFTIDMPIRRRHMELWEQAIKQINSDEKETLLKMIQLKIEVYAFLENLNFYSFFKRFFFLKKHINVVGLRESYYLFGGRLGVLSWRWVKIILNRQ